MNAWLAVAVVCTIVMFFFVLWLASDSSATPTQQNPAPQPGRGQQFLAQIIPSWKFVKGALIAVAGVVLLLVLFLFGTVVLTTASDAFDWDIWHKLWMRRLGSIPWWWHVLAAASLVVSLCAWVWGQWWLRSKTKRFCRWAITLVLPAYAIICVVYASGGNLDAVGTFAWRLWHLDPYDVREWFSMLQMPSFPTDIPIMGWASIVATTVGLISWFGSQKKRRWLAPVAALLAGVATLFLLSIDPSDFTQASFRHITNDLLNWLHTFPVWGQICGLAVATIGLVLTLKTLGSK